MMVRSWARVSPSMTAANANRCVFADDRVAPPRPAADLPRRRFRHPGSCAVRLLPVPQRRRDVGLLGAARRDRDPVHALGRGVLGPRRRAFLDGDGEPGGDLPGWPAAPHRQRRLHALPASLDGVPGERHCLRLGASLPEDARSRRCSTWRTSRRRRSTCPKPAAAT